MSGGTVCVLALNGRRQTVKCSPNTTILQILEEVCRKQELNPANYDLKHHNKVLDTTTTFRFSGLPNNAQLELVDVVRVRSEGEIILAVNLENGKRLLGNFSPNNTLLEVLQKLCPECLKQNISPVVIYTRREIYGKELETVTLRSLGVTGGRAMIRVLNRAPEDLKTQANVSTVIAPKPVEEQPYIRKYQPVEQPPPTYHEEDPKKHDGHSQSNNDDSNIQNIDPSKTQKVQKKDNVDLIKLAREKRKSSEFQSPKTTERKKSFSEKQGNITKVNPCSCGKNHDVMKDDFVCPNNCKGSCNKEESDKITDDFVFLGDRNAMLFSQESAEAIPSEELPDDFFDLTLDDARRLLRDVKKQRHFMENSPLLTSNLRNLEDSKKQLRQMNKYKKAIIRIQFPDRVVLQGTFNPSDTIRDVVDFIRQYLEDNTINFYIYSTPPKCILDESKRLTEVGFVPGALVHFGVPDINWTEKKSFLRKDLQNKFTSNSVASLAAAKIRRQNTRKCGVEAMDDCDYDFTEDPNKSTTAVNDGASTSTGIRHEEENEEKKVHYSPPENVPKWFRPL